MANLQVTLKKSLVGQKKNIRETAKTLGLKKVGQTTVREDNPVIKGQLRTVRHLVEVEEVN